MPQKLLIFFVIKITKIFLCTLLLSFCLYAENALDPTTSNLKILDQINKNSNLILDNPFVPKNKNLQNQPKGPLRPSQSPVNQGQILQKYLEFKSISIINKKKFFSIFNKRTNDSFWISENEAYKNFRVTYFDPTNYSISITDGINSEILTMITANETPLKVISAKELVKAEDKVLSPVSEAKPVEKNNKVKPPPRRRVIPVKR